jgi:hypothetical protein
MHVGVLNTACLAQEVTEARPLAEAQPASARRSVIASAGLGAAGFLAGGLLGIVAQLGCTGDQCEIDGLVLGGIFGLTIGSSVGAHAGNRRSGALGVDLVASAGALALGIGLSNLLFEDNGNPFLLVIPVAQLAAAVTAERKVAARRLQGVHAGVGVRGARPSLSLRVTI